MSQAFLSGWLHAQQYILAHSLQQSSHKQLYKSRNAHLCCVHELRFICTFCNAGALRKIFTSFASFAVRVPIDDLDGAKFSKLCRDAKLLGKQFNAIDVDIVFAKVKVSQHL